MSKKVEWIKEQIENGQEVYIFITEKNYLDRFDHMITPEVNIEGKCKRIRENHYQNTISLNSFYAHGCSRDEMFIQEIAKSLELCSFDKYMKVLKGLRVCDGLRTMLADNSVLAIKKQDGRYVTSVINLDDCNILVKSWDEKRGFLQKKCYDESIPYTRRGVGCGESIDEAIAKTALIYNAERCYYIAQGLKQSVQEINESESEA